MNNAQQEVIAALMNGGIAVVRTDTLYGIIARANDEQAVERVYEAKSRDPHKSCIVLLADAQQAYGSLSLEHIPTDRPTSILIDSPAAPEWLRRQNNEIAYRLPAVPWLREIIREVGPVIAPSANPEGLPPATTIAEAKQYFGDKVDVYVDSGEVPSDTPASRLIRQLPDGTNEVLR